MDRELATAIAVYVVEAVGGHDRTVGGPTRVGIIHNPAIQLDLPRLPVLGKSEPAELPRALAGLTPPACVLGDADVRTISAITSRVKRRIEKRHAQLLKTELTRESIRKINEMMKRLREPQCPPPPQGGTQK